MNFNGSIESIKITNEALIKIKFIFKNIFDSHKYSLYSWGSISRKEMGPFSDLDLLILSNCPNIHKINEFRSKIKKELPNNNLDLLVAYTPDELTRIGNIDGTDRQAILFKKKECGCNIKINTVENNIREILHILFNLEIIYPELYKNNNLKFSPFYLKYFYFATIISNFMGNNKLNITSSLKYLKDKNIITRKEYIINNNNFNELLFFRNKIQQISHSSQCLINTDNLNILSNQINLKNKFIKKKLCAIRKNTKKLYIILKNIAINIASNCLNTEELNILKLMLKNKNNWGYKLAKKVLNRKNELLSLLLGYTAKNPKILEQLRSQNLTNWYVLYAIANNKHASEQTLFRLMVPLKKEIKIVTSLYTDYSWRNIYLYIAKNPSATKRIKTYIINYPNARKMDIDAAKQ